VHITEPGIAMEKYLQMYFLVHSIADSIVPVQLEI